MFPGRKSKQECGLTEMNVCGWNGPLSVDACDEGTQPMRCRAGIHAQIWEMHFGRERCSLAVSGLTEEMTSAGPSQVERAGLDQPTGLDQPAKFYDNRIVCGNSTIVGRVRHKAGGGVESVADEDAARRWPA